MRDLGFILLGLFLMIVPICAPIVGAMIYLKSLKCHSEWADSGIESDWSMVAGCRVNFEGKWIPADRFRVIK